MLTLRRAFKNIFRRRLRTLLVSFVLALCVAVLISTIAGVSASEQSTKEMVARVEANTVEMVAKVQADTEEMVAGIEASTEEMVAQVEQGAEETIGLTELMSRMIMVSSGFGFMPGARGGGIGDEGNSLISEDVVDSISSVEGVAAVLPTLTEMVGESDDPRDYDYAVTGVPLDSSLVEEYSVLPSNIITGRQIEEGDGAAVLLSQDLISSGYFQAGVGDTITLEGSHFEVVGIFYSTQFEGQRTIYMSLENAQNLFDEEGYVSSLTVYAETEDVVDDVAGEIEDLDSSWFVMIFQDMPTGGFGEQITMTQEEQVARIQEQASQQIATLQEQASQQIATIEEQASQQIAALQNDVSNIENLGLQISLVVGIAGVLMIFGLMFYTVRERTKEIGTLKALGFSNWNVMKQFMYEGLYIGLIGGAIGLGIAAASASVLGGWLLNPGDALSTSVSMTVTMEAMLLGLAVAVIAGALGSLYPAWRASRVSPMEALRNE